MALASYFNWDTSLQADLISIFQHNPTQQEQDQQEQALLLPQHHYHNHHNNHLLTSNYYDHHHNYLYDHHNNNYTTTNTNLLYPPHDFLIPNEYDYEYDPLIMTSLLDNYNYNYNESLIPCPKRQKQHNFFSASYDDHMMSLMEEPASQYSSFNNLFHENNYSNMMDTDLYCNEMLDLEYSHYRGVISSNNGVGDYDEIMKKHNKNSEVVVIENEKEKAVSSQSKAARERRRKITEKTQELAKLVPNASNMNTADMLRSAANYLSFLKSQLQLLQLAHTLKEEKALCGSEDLQALLTSPYVEEKLYMKEMCLVPKEFVTTLTNHQDVKSRLSILNDLNHLIGKGTEKK